MAGEGKIHVIENHLASNDNEEDVIFDQVDFKGMGFRSGTAPTTPHQWLSISFVALGMVKPCAEFFSKSLKRNQWWI